MTICIVIYKRMHICAYVYMHMCACIYMHKCMLICYPTVIYSRSMQTTPTTQTHKKGPRRRWTPKVGQPPREGPENRF